MRKLSFLIIVFFCLVSCEKSEFLPDNEIPDWLKERIAQDEIVIQETPSMMENFGAWARFEFEDEYYFEYINELSSQIINIYTQEGNRPEFNPDKFNEFFDERCCKKYVWKAPAYPDLSGNK